jgi:hypothetical protein
MLNIDVHLAKMSIMNNQTLRGIALNISTTASLVLLI